MKFCLSGSSGVSLVILNFCEGGGGVLRGRRKPLRARAEGAACPPDVESRYLLPVFVPAPLFADFFNRESGFDDALVVAHASLPWKSC